MKPLNRQALKRRIARDTAKLEKRDTQALANFGTMTSLVALICSQYNVTMRELQGHDRNRRICHPRQLLVYLLKQRTTYTLSQLSRIFDVTSSAILATVKTVTIGLETQCSYGREIAALTVQCSKFDVQCSMFEVPHPRPSPLDPKPLRP